MQPSNFTPVAEMVRTLFPFALGFLSPTREVGCGQKILSLDLNALDIFFLAI